MAFRVFLVGHVDAWVLTCRLLIKWSTLSVPWRPSQTGPLWRSLALGVRRVKIVHLSAPGPPLFFRPQAKAVFVRNTKKKNSTKKTNKNKNKRDRTLGDLKTMTTLCVCLANTHTPVCILNFFWFQSNTSTEQQLNNYNPPGYRDNHLYDSTWIL